MLTFDLLGYAVKNFVSAFPLVRTATDKTHQRLEERIMGGLR